MKKLEAADFSFIFDKKKVAGKLRLDGFRDKPIAHSGANPPRAPREAACAIKANFGVSASISPVYRFLKAGGAERLKAGNFPSKAGSLEQRESLNSAPLRPQTR
ncbi:MAG: hypothetical protein LBU32_30345 [Clostridiales bacterium]|nr:hypothetical protein [Clostridiales bacterium]